MSQVRIALLGQRWNEHPATPGSHALLDYASVPAQAEGFCLVYDFLLEDVPLLRDSCRAIAFVTAEGVQAFSSTAPTPRCSPDRPGQPPDG